ncbi:hypothetical protein IJ096_01105, partial [Candidatus Saccharibacteria bacterium]|nr:hypothetical protein [Candidatus Saccharibacteria bacterium]
MYRNDAKGDLTEGRFTFLGYDFDYVEATAHFYYQGAEGTQFHEVVKFQKPENDYDHEVLDRVMFLAFGLVGTSYYKARPTREVLFFDSLDEFQARYFKTVYQEGLSQFAYENHLTREDLAEFKATEEYVAPEAVEYQGRGRVVMESGGKDSLLTASLLSEEGKGFTPVFVSSNGKYPKVLDGLGHKVKVITRKIDSEGLRAASGMNGHVPVTYIVQTLALLQAVLDNKREVLTSIGKEGVEANTEIGDLAVNHQWSKTEEAETLYNEYVHRYIAKEIVVRSPLRKYTELEIAKMFAEKCWEKYGEKFSSCNVAYYRQGEMAEE